jgi:hypothetical protein
LRRKMWMTEMMKMMMRRRRRGGRWGDAALHGNRRAGRFSRTPGRQSQKLTGERASYVGRRGEAIYR